MTKSKSHADDAQLIAATERAYEGPQAFRAFSAPVWKDGSLSVKDKHLVAVAVAQITRCAFCIEHHAELARRFDASVAESLAVSYIAAALEALGEAQLGFDGDEIVIETEAALAGKPIAAARQAFTQKVFGSSTLAPALVWVVAAAVAYTQSQEARRLVLHKQALANGAASEALDEAYAIAAVLRAGAVYAHTLHVLDAFREA